jgi:hypothetical protein
LGGEAVYRCDLPSPTAFPERSEESHRLQTAKGLDKVVREIAGFQQVSFNLWNDLKDDAAAFEAGGATKGTTLIRLPVKVPCIIEDQGSRRELAFHALELNQYLFRPFATSARHQLEGCPAAMWRTNIQSAE